MSALLAWPQADGIAYSAPGVYSQYATVRAAVRAARVAALAGDGETAAVLRAAIVRRWSR